MMRITWGIRGRKYCSAGLFGCGGLWDRDTPTIAATNTNYREGFPGIERHGVR